jgi:hypothetical protein
MKNEMNGALVPALSIDAQLKRKVRTHLSRLGFVRGDDGLLSPPKSDKSTVRTLHSLQRQSKILQNQKFVGDNFEDFRAVLADGREIDPQKIKLSLQPIATSSKAGDLFRMASLTWSVPVSNGFGRRIRFLIWDEYHDKLAGIAALGDPVFNLSVRDSEIGWNSDDRRERLCNVLDAYILGALPPYNQLLCGKAIACMLRSKEVFSWFQKKYGASAGLISQKKKKPQLLAYTTSSSMGRSSIYNRLKLDGDQYLMPIGYSKGWGHFHIPDELFLELRQYLASIDHPYAKQHEFGAGPNWRLRAIKAAFGELGIQQNLLHHGVKRQVFVGYFAKNAREILSEGTGVPALSSLKPIAEIFDLAMDRWVVPRSNRRPDFRDWEKTNLLKLIDSNHSENQLKAIQSNGY